MCKTIESDFGKGMEHIRKIGDINVNIYNSTYAYDKNEEIITALLENVLKLPLRSATTIL